MLLYSPETVMALYKADIEERRRSRSGSRPRVKAPIAPAKAVSMRPVVAR